MIENDIDKLKSDFKVLKNEFVEKTKLEIKITDLPKNSIHKAYSIYKTGNKFFEIFIQNSLPEKEYYLDLIHEIIHGILFLVEDFSNLFFKEKYKDSEIESFCKIIVGYVDDEVVHKRIFSLGHNFIDPLYPQEIRKSLILIKKRESHKALSIYGNNNLASDLYRAMFYVQSLGFKKFYSDCFEEDDFKNLTDFIKLFPVRYKNPFKNACKIKQLFEKYDVFSAPGNDLIKKSIITILNLERFIEVKGYNTK